MELVSEFFGLNFYLGGHVIKGPRAREWQFLIAANGKTEVAQHEGTPLGKK